MRINPYLHFNGHCAEAFKFYEQVLHGKIGMMMTYGEAPAGQPVQEDSLDKIMHAQMTVGDQVIMGSDAPGAHFKPPQGMSVTLGIDTVEEAERVFHALAEGGAVHMPIQETFWANRFGMLADKFGIPWMVNCEKPF